MMQKQEFDYCFKIFLLGNQGVGKSSMFLKYAENIVTSTYKQTIGIDFRCKIFPILNQLVKLHLWDTAGDQRFREVVATCLRDADGALICFDLTNQDSFQDAEGWIQLFKECASENAPIVLIACKSDLVLQRVVDYNAARKMAQELGVNYIEVSACEGIQIDEAFTALANQLLLRPTLNKITPILERYYENYLKIYSRYNTQSLFTTQPSIEEAYLQNDYGKVLQKLLYATTPSEVNEYYENTLTLIKNANALYEKKNPFWGKFVSAPLAIMLKQSLNDALPYICNFVTPIRQQSGEINFPSEFNF